MSRVTDSQKVQKELELRIIKGFYRENSPMPSTKEVHDEFHIGATTVQAIYTEMKNEGTIFAKQGKGTWVSPYCTVKLRKKHVDQLRNEIYALKEYAEEIGLDFLEEVNLVLSSGAANS
jgi:DNA-binding transcriptional regulator YhcF (GntR family)